MKSRRIAIIGGGPSALYLYKRLVDSGRNDISVDIYEAKSRLGQGMPYGPAGAGREHITNVSSAEIPALVTPAAEWIATLSPAERASFGLEDSFNENRVLPRLLLGAYLEHQFELLLARAGQIGLATRVHFNSRVADIVDRGTDLLVKMPDAMDAVFDSAVICTGHQWPVRREDRIPGYFDSPYPPAKLAKRFNHPVAILGSSLTAVDAVRTLARHNGHFAADGNGKLVFHPDSGSPDFRLSLYSRHGLLPALRFHTEHAQIGGQDVLIPEEIVARNRQENDGFLSLDFVFRNYFLERLREKDAAFYARFANLTLEDFVIAMLEARESRDPFELLKTEYAEAERSIRAHRSIQWKEALALLSFTMNYPAKHFPAEDMLRLQNVLSPLIAVVIAFLPQGSARELLALHDAGRLALHSSGAEGRVEPADRGAVVTGEDGSAIAFETFIDCTGQPHLSFEDFPFRSLIEAGAVSPARLRFREIATAEAQLAQGQRDVEEDDGLVKLRVPGLAVDDSFRALRDDGLPNPGLYLMAVPHMAGYNPDYSGLDFCEEASRRIAEDIFAGL